MADSTPAEPKRSAQDILAEIRNGIEAGNKKHDESLARFDKLEKRVEAVEAKNKVRTVGMAPGGWTLPGVEDEKRKFSLQRAVLAVREKNRDVAPFEWDVMRETYKANEPMYLSILAGREKLGEGRDMSTDVDSAGGFLVPEQALGDYVEMLRAATVAEELGATVLTGLTGAPVKLNKQTGDVTAYWVTEAGTVTASDAAFGEITMYPREAAARVEVSNRLLEMSNPSVEAKIRESMAKQVGLLQDLAILQGSGGTQPIGILNLTDVNTTSMSAVPSPDTLFDMIYQIEVDNAAGDDMAWAFHPRTWHSLRKTKDAEGNYILIPKEGSIRAGTLLGLPFKTTTQIPITLGAGDASRIYVGRWSEVLVGRWGGMEISVSKETSDAFERRQTHILLTSLMDTAIRHGQSFCLDSTVAA